MRPLLPTALLAALALAAPAAAAAAPRSIALESYEGISTVRPDGTGRTLVVRNADAPSWSPDHTHLAYISRNAIWTARADGTHRRRVTSVADGVPFDPAWSPDGTRIAYTKYTETPRPGGDDGEVDEVHTVFTIRTDGTARRKVRAGDFPAWTPTGNHIVLAQSKGRAGMLGSTVAIVKPDGSHYRRLVDSDSYISDLAVAPGGRRIAYVQALGTVAIGVYDRATERNRLLLEKGALPDVAWTPDGSRLAWLQHPIWRRAGQAPPTRLYTAKPDGSGRRTQIEWSDGLFRPDALAW